MRGVVFPTTVGLLVAIFTSNCVHSFWLFGCHPQSRTPLSDPSEFPSDSASAKIPAVKFGGFVFQSSTFNTPCAPFDKIHHSDDRWFSANNVTPSLSWKRRVIQTSPLSLDVYIDLPPYYWATPLALDAESSRLFWLHPENHLHFNSSVEPTSGKVQIFFNADLKRGMSRTTMNRIIGTTAPTLRVLTTILSSML